MAEDASLFRPTQRRSEAAISSLLGAPDGVPPTELLIAAALAHRVNDNVTAVVVETL